MGGARAVITRVRPAPPRGAPPDTRQGSGRIPEELLAEQVARLGVFTAVAGTIWAFGLLMDTVVLPATGRPPNWRSIRTSLFFSTTAASDRAH